MIIRLKWGQTEYKGTLESIDSYMNVLLRDTEEYIDGKQTGSLGLVLIRYVTAICLQFCIAFKRQLLIYCLCRCNNILWMGSADSVEMTDLELK